MKKILAVVALLVASAIGYITYHDYRAGYFDMPELADGEFALVFDGGLRAIFSGLPDERATRQYMSLSSEKFPEWFADAWSRCRPPTQEERGKYSYSVARNPGTRFDAICEIKADNDVIVRGFIITAPKI